MDDPAKFLKRLVGLLKNRIKTSQGIVSLNSLAAATAQTVANINSGLEWLESNDYIRLISLKDDQAKIETGTRVKNKNAPSSASHLISMLAESAAFRRYYLSANKDRLVIYDAQP